MTMKTSESVRKYGQQVKALIHKLTMEIAPSVQVEWYVAGFPEAMGFQIRQTRPAKLRDAMEAADNYDNSAQSLWKAVRRSKKQDKGKGKKEDRKSRRRRKFPTRIVIPRVPIRKRAIPLHPDRKKNGICRHQDDHTDPKEQERMQ
jgi:hypothetical protein